MKKLLIFITFIFLPSLLSAAENEKQILLEKKVYLSELLDEVGIRTNEYLTREYLDFKTDTLKERIAATDASINSLKNKEKELEKRIQERKNKNEHSLRLVFGETYVKNLSSIHKYGSVFVATDINDIELTKGEIAKVKIKSEGTQNKEFEVKFIYSESGVLLAEGNRIKIVDGWVSFEIKRFNQTMLVLAEIKNSEEVKL
jgi:hypothetical protein